MSKTGARQGIRGTISGALRGIDLGVLRVTKETALSMGILGLVVVIAILMRVLPLRWGAYFTAYDPLFQYRVTEYVVKNGYASWFKWHDTLSWYPMGRDIAQSSYPGVPFSAAFVYQLLSVIGLRVSVYNVCLFFPLLMASITCVAAYFLGKDLGGRATGLFAAFFMAVSAAFIGRTSLGFFDTENIGIFGMVTTSLLFLRSIERNKKFEYRMLYALAAGLSMGYVFASWGAARYIPSLITLFVFADLVFGLYDSRVLVSYGFTMGVGFAIATMVPKLGPAYLTDVENVAVLAVMLGLLAYEGIKERVDPGKLRVMGVGVVGVLIVGVLALSALGVVTPLGGKFLRVLNPFAGGKSPLFQSVAEHKLSPWTDFFGRFGLNLALGMLGSYFALKGLTEKKLYGLLFFLTALYFAGTMSRLALILAYPASLMAAYGLVELLKPFANVMRQRAPDRRRRRRLEAFGVSRELGFIIVAVLLIASLPTIWSTANNADNPTSLASSAINVRFGGEYPQDWLQAFSWIRSNTPEDAVVVSWWDYGYWIEAMANRTTLADGATMNTWQIANIAKAMVLPQNESIKILEKYGADYIVVFVTFNPNNPQEEWGYGDNAKWRWMVNIGGFNESDYIDFQTGQYKDKYYETTIYNLMYRKANSDYFKLAFASDYNYVLVYKIVYQGA